MVRNYANQLCAPGKIIKTFLLKYPGSNNNTSVLATSKYLDTLASIACNKQVSFLINCQSNRVIITRQR